MSSPGGGDERRVGRGGPPAGAAEPADVVVVGSGAAGGMAAYALTRAGARVILLEAGRSYDPLAETPMFNRAFEAPLRAAPTPDKPFGFYDATVEAGWDLSGEPYEARPGSEFRWFRARMLGGRTNHWGRVSLRYADHDFRGRSADGLGADWPFGYAELEPYYDRVERLIGVFGSRDGLEDAPDSPPGVLLPPPEPRAFERLLMRGGAKLGRPVVANHAAVLTLGRNGRSPCCYATPCVRGCSLAANFQSTTVLLPPALATGRLRIRSRAMATELDLAADGRARGVRFVDRLTGRTGYVPGRAVVVAAGAMESVRLLLNSRGPGAPDGVGGGSGWLGRGVMDSTGSNLWAQVPALEDLPAYNEEGVSYPHVYLPWWGLGEQRAGRLPFARGYHVEFVGGRPEPSAETFDDAFDRALGPSMGVGLKRDARRYFGSFIRLASRGEMLARPENRVEVSPDVRDRWGVPVPVFDVRWSEQELEQTRHAQRSMAELVEAAGGRVVVPPPADPARAILQPGAVIHEVGGARASKDPEAGVCDGFGRVRGAPNVYLVDGAVFPSSAHKNPTLTILAFAWRACEDLLRRSRDGHPA